MSDPYFDVVLDLFDKQLIDFHTAFHAVGRQDKPETQEARERCHAALVRYLSRRGAA